MGKALYRKYRPKTLSEVVGEEQVTDVLKNAIESGKIFHSYLFIGPRGCGKTSVARIFAHEVNNFKYELEDEYIDIIEIDGASNTGIDNIRELREKANIAPTKGKYKVYIIDEVHMLSKSAFNGLLKTLEEPPKHVIFIMATTDAYKVPATITSRSQVFTFKLADEKVMFPYMKSICDKEGINIENDALEQIVKRGGGSFRDTLSILDQISIISKNEITKEDVLNCLGLPESEDINDLLASYEEKNLISVSEKLNQLFSKNTKAEIITEELIGTIIKSPTPTRIKLLSKLTEVKPPFSEAKLLIALTSNIEEEKNIQNISAEKTSFAPKKSFSELKKSYLESVQKKQTESAPKSEPQATKRQTSIAEAGELTWDVFLMRVHESNDLVYAQLGKTKHELKDNRLDLYPAKPLIENILNKNRAIINSAANGATVIIHTAGEEFGEKSELVSKISDIMGKVEEVDTNAGDVPF